MPDRKLDIAFWNYDRTRLLADGTVKIEGFDAAFHSARIVPEIFKAMIKDRAYDVSELGMTYFLRLFSDDDPPFLALPVFLVRSKPRWPRPVPWLRNRMDTLFTSQRGEA
jgi:4,5-dihydroxyphthalate decarboxylase